MSKAAKLISIILFILLLVAIGLAGYTLLEKQKIEHSKQSLEEQVEQSQAREKKHILDNKKLQEQLADIENSKSKLQANFSDVDTQLEDLNKKIAELTTQRDDLQARYSTLEKERNDLVKELKEKPRVKIVYKESPQPESTPTTSEFLPSDVKFEQLGDTYWAQLIKEKAALEVELKNLKDQLSSGSLEVEELKKKNTDFQLELGELKSQKELIEQEIRYNKDLIDSLSLELARSKNNQMFFTDRVKKMSDENSQLRQTVKELTSTKIGLEKTIVHLTEEKQGLEKKLYETESMIQGKIKEIWNIKDNLDQTFKNDSFPTPSIVIDTVAKKPSDRKSLSTSEVQLPPIIVSSGAMTDTQPQGDSSKTLGFNGNVVSVNEDNNFVIVDLGESSGVRIGDALNIYRGAKYVAGLEVIQVRKDICAADIKQKTTDIKVGDIVQ